MSVLAFYAQFTKTLVGVNSLTVTWDVEQITRSDGTRSALVTGGATSITIGRRGLYGYLLAAADTKLYDYVATAITAGDVDQKEIAALWTMYEADTLKVSGDAGAADNLELFFDGTGYASAGSINSVTGTVTLADDGITAATLADSAIAEIAAAATGGATMQQMRDAMLLAPSTGTPAAGSIDDHLDALDAALAAATSTLTVVSAVDGDVLTIYQAVSFSATISGLAIPSAWTKLWWTVKQDSSQADTDAIIQMVESNPGAGTDGLLRLNGAAGTAANGTLTVSQAAGTVVIDLVDENTDDLALATGLIWSLKALATGGATTLLAVGTLNVRGQATAALA